jgi:hypothetical protein
VIRKDLLGLCRDPEKKAGEIVTERARSNMVRDTWLPRHWENDYRIVPLY